MNTDLFFDKVICIVLLIFAIIHLMPMCATFSGFVSLIINYFCVWIVFDTIKYFFSSNDGKKDKEENNEV